MKNVRLVFLLGLFLAGCSHLGGQSEFWQHDSMYKNWDHTKFSIYGYQNPTVETGTKSQEQAWWGIDIPYIPAQ
jgi:hypothetical protein